MTEVPRDVPSLRVSSTERIANYFERDSKGNIFCLHCHAKIGWTENPFETLEDEPLYELGLHIQQCRRRAPAAARGVSDSEVPES